MGRKQTQDEIATIAKREIAEDLSVLCCDNCRYMDKLVETILSVLRKSSSSHFICHPSSMEKENACSVPDTVSGTFGIEIWQANRVGFS